jgi:N-acetylmuramoyl-L-alanine amidase
MFRMVKRDGNRRENIDSYIRPASPCASSTPIDFPSPKLSNPLGLQQRVMMAILVGCLSVVTTAGTAQAAKLQSWRFDTSSSSLVFATSETIVPRVQLIPNPVRLVVDLPGVRNQPRSVQSYGRGVKSLRIGQFDRETARLVLELEPGYSVDPEQVKVESLSALAWQIKLPTPQFTGEQSLPSTPTSPPVPAPISLPPVSQPPSNSSPIAVSSNNVLDDVLVTPEGLFFKTQRGVEDLQIRRTGDRRTINIELPGVTATQVITRNAYRIDYHGIERVIVNQVSNSPPLTRVSLRVNRRSPDWTADANRVAGITLTPQSRSSATANANIPPRTISLSGSTASVMDPPRAPSTGIRPGSSAAAGQTAMIQAVSLGGSQLLIRTDRSLFFTTGVEGSNYRITLLNSRLSPQLRQPSLGVGSPLSQIQMVEDGRNIKILFAPTQGIRFAGVTRLDGQTLVANLLRPGESPSTSIPVPPPTGSNPVPPVMGSPTPPNFPRPSGRKVVVLDPGHGGPDPGAIGIGGIREVDIVIDIGLQVSRLLQKQGVVVYLTRTTNAEDVDLAPRVSMAERVRATAFVSIHANAISMSRPDVNGLETFYAPGAYQGRELAETIHNAVLRTANVRNRSLRAARFYVIRRSSMPAALVETGFVTGAEDAPKLATPEHRSRIAAGIAQGILEFLSRR